MANSTLRLLGLWRRATPGIMPWFHRTRTAGFLLLAGWIPSTGNPSKKNPMLQVGLRATFFGFS
jgi:hypothetical protein